MTDTLYINSKRKLNWTPPKKKKSLPVPSTSVMDLIGKLGQEEADFLKSEFISPIYNNQIVVTKISGLVYSFKIPKSKPGWYRLKPIDSKKAEIIGEADLFDIDNYLKKLSKIRMILVKKIKGLYFALPEKNSSIGPGEYSPVFLCDDSVLDFDRIMARYDGCNLWFECLDQNNDPLKAHTLRENMKEFKKLENISGLTPEEKAAYILRFTIDQQLSQDMKEHVIKHDVEFAGGKFVQMIEKTDHYTVEYIVDSERYISHIAKNSQRSVISAGICLDGGDSAFDLRSLITVIREGQDRDLIHRTR